MTFLLAASNPAGGAALREVIGASLGAGVASTLLFGLGLGHRAGRTHLLERWSAFAARVGGLPAWVALPSAVGTVSLITALLGMYWDISLHIDQGRDPGPLANPAHYFILSACSGSSPPASCRWRSRRRSRARRRCGIYSGLVRAARRLPDDRGRRLRADRLPARRRLAPPVRPGRDAVGPDAPDADRRRVRVADRPGRAARRGRPRPGRPRGARRRDARAADAAPRGARRRLPDRPLDVPGRVRLRRAAVRLPLPADADRARREHRAGLRAPVGRPRRGARRRRVLPRRARLRVADGARRVGRVAAALPALPGRGAARRGERGDAAQARPAHVRRGRRPADRHRRHGGRVGVVARLDAAAVAVGAAARGRARDRAGRRRRRAARHVHRHGAARAARAVPARRARRLSARRAGGRRPDRLRPLHRLRSRA